MARDHARLLYRIWSEDDDFVDLSEPAQRLYTLILSQPTVSYAGVTSYTVRRWTRLSRTSTADGIREAAQELSDARFIVVDEETEEVFIRTYVRNDNILSNPNVAIAAVRAYRQIASRKIRAAWIEELERLHAESLASDTPDKAWTDPKSCKLLAEALAEPVPAGKKSQVKTGPERGPEPPPEGGPSGRGPEGGLPTRARTTRAAPAPSPSPAPSPLRAQPPSNQSAATDPASPPAGADKPRHQRTSTATADKPDGAQAVVAAYIDGAVNAGHDRPAGSLPGRVGREAKRLLAEGVSLDKLIAAATTMGRRGFNDLAVQLQRDSAERAGTRDNNGRRGWDGPHLNYDDPHAFDGYRPHAVEHTDDVA